MNDRIECVVQEIDEADLDEIERSMPTGFSHHHRARYAKHRSGDATYLIAWVDGRPAGHLLLKWNGCDAAEVRARLQRCPELNAVGVVGPLRSRGLGTQLIVTAEERIRERGYRQAGLAVGVENTRARHLYERLGYRDWGHGEFDTSWLETDRDGRRFTAHERCTFLVKELQPPTS